MTKDFFGLHSMRNQFSDSYNLNANDRSSSSECKKIKKDLGIRST